MRVCVCVYACVSTFGYAWAGGMSEKDRKIESSTTTTHAYCTARVYLCVFAQWGFLGADLSEFCCVSSSVGNMNIHEALLSLVKASCRSAECRSEGVHGCFVHTAEVNQCFIAVSLFFFFLPSGRAGGGRVNQDSVWKTVFCIQVSVLVPVCQN